MKLIIASNNKHKISEIKSILAGKFEEILSLSEAGINHETVEDGETFLENSLKKAREICAISGAVALADDSGLCVNFLGGAPGVYSARYSGEGATAESNNRLLLKNLEDKADRSGAFVCAIAYVSKDEEFTVRGEAHGTILKEREGRGGFGYDPLFFSTDANACFGALAPEEKNKYSHRRRAIEAFIKKWKG